MAYTTPITWTAGQIVTAAQMNQDVRDNVSFLANPPSCRVYHSADVAIAHATLTTLGVTGATTAVFDSERFDTAAMHSTSVNPGRITFTTAGVYVVSLSGVLGAGNDYNIIEFRLMLNGSTQIATSDLLDLDTNHNPALTVTTIYKFAANDYVIPVVFQSNGAAASRNLITQGNNSPEFSATWIGLG